MLVLDYVAQFVDQNPQAFITGDKGLADAALKATKYIFDLSLQQENTAYPAVTALVRSYESDTKPVTRSQTKAAAEKALPSTSLKTSSEDVWQLTPINSLLLDGMDDDQVWAQLELRTANLCQTLKSVLEYDPIGDEDRSDEEGIAFEERDDDDDDDDDNDEELESETSEGGLEDEGDAKDEEEEDVELEEKGESSEDEIFLEGTTNLHDPSDEETASENEENKEGEDDYMDLDKSPSARSKPGIAAISPSKPSTEKGGQRALDDGFFSLADFKAEIESAESKRVTRGRLDEDENDVDGDEDLESDIDLFAPMEETDFGGDLDAKMADYNDFFAPPKRIKSGQLEPNSKKKIPIPKPKKSSLVRFNDEVKVRNIKGTGKGLSVKSLEWQFDVDEEHDEEQGAEDLLQDFENDESDSAEDDEGEEGEEEEEEEEEDGRGAIERFKDDLFADGEEEETFLKDFSTHEARQAEIAAQIKQLEEENVAPKPWALMGEATTRSRPVNSLLEEDLEFDRVMKAAPVVTEESVSSLEEIIKKRILDNKFDDVVRTRPVDDKPFLPSRLFELDDKKSSKGLAEIYAEEYTAATSGTSTDTRDEKLKQQHIELGEMWENICYKLDALSNAHFTPKPPKATITTISNVATAILESALPTTVSTTTMLAPEEMYTPDSSALRSKTEMTPSEKKSLRNNQRKTRKKAQNMIKSVKDSLASNNHKLSNKFIKKEKEKAFRNVMKTGRGVSVVGKQHQKPKNKQISSEGLKL